jgi:hypothetical protein
MMMCSGIWMTLLVLSRPRHRLAALIAACSEVLMNFVLYASVHWKPGKAFGGECSNHMQNLTQPVWKPMFARPDEY